MLTLLLTTLFVFASTAIAENKLRALQRLRPHVQQIQSSRCLPVREIAHRAAAIPQAKRAGALVSWQRSHRAVHRMGRRCERLGPVAAIRYVFGAYAGQALTVAWCESRLSVWARNGQYLGLFQMGEYARAAYGHSWTAFGQSRSAHDYFVDSGRDWSPWACRP